MLEQKIQTKILQWLEKQGYYATKIIVASKNGESDIHCCANGKFVVIEVKQPGKTANPLQLYKQRRVLAAGGKVLVADNLDTVKKFFNEL